MRSWDRYLSERDRAIFAESGWGQRVGLGARPVVLVVDVNYAFAGDRSESVEASIVRWPYSCGDAGWKAAESIRRVVETARARRVPVFYTTGLDPNATGFGAGRWAGKHRRRERPRLEDLALGNTILPPIAPTPLDIVLRKAKPSAFFGTPLLAYLVDLAADSVIVCGSTTSGCVRATVFDAFSYNYRLMVVEDGTFDRSEISHAINLFDMDQKYADVVPSEETTRYLEGLKPGLFDDQMPGLRGRTAATPAGIS